MQLIAADEEQKRNRDRLTHAAWGQRLSEEAFCAREARLRAHPWSREAMRTWLWVDETGEALASCETFRMASTFQGTQGESQGVASVFTAPALRGRGHAGAMMQALAARIRAERQQTHALLLFSEVGATLYQRAGYVPLACHDRLVAAATLAPPPAAALRWFGEGALSEALSSIPAPQDPFVVWPGVAQLDWHLERERIYAASLRRQRPRHCGVRIGGAAAIWAADYKNERLAVLLAAAPDETAASHLAAAAAAAAREVGLAEVRFWETPALPLPASLGSRVPRDDDALPMLLPLQPGLEAAHWRSIPRALWI